MKQVRYETVGTFVLTIDEVPWEASDPRGAGGQYEFHCNETVSEVMFACRYFTYWGSTGDPHAIEQLSQAEYSYNEALRMIRDIIT